MKFPILLTTITLIGTLSTACAASKRCISPAFADMASSYAAIGQNNQALQIAQNIENLTLKANVLSQIAVQSAKAGQREQAATMFSQSLQVANKIESPPDKVMALEAIATRYRIAGQNDKAAEVLSQAVRDADEIWGTSFVKDTVLERIAINYAKLGDYDRGIQIANKIVDDIPKSRALARIVAQYVAVGNYNQARQVADTIEVQTSKANALIEIAAKTGDYQQALSVAQKIDEEESVQLKSIILGKIALLYSKAGQEKQAVEVLSQALQTAQKIEETGAKVRQLIKVALQYAEVGKKEQAVAISSQVLQVASHNQEANRKAEFLTRVAFVYETVGRHDLATSVFARALQIAQTVDNEDKKAQTLAKLAIASAEIKPYNQVLPIAQSIQDASIQADVLIQIARHYARVERNEEARQALERALQINQRSNKSHDKTQRIAEIAIELGKIAQYDSAIAIAQTLDTREKDSPKALVLAKIAGSYVKAGQKEKAIAKRCCVRPWRCRRLAQIALLSQALETARTTKCSE
jgi:tetratricopeptide (TPR) repeat protein